MIGCGNPDISSESATIIASPGWLPPLQRYSTPPPSTQTLPAKVIHHQAVTKFQDVLRHVHTEAELQNLTEDIDALM
jgi:hypothetical protein